MKKLRILTISTVLAIQTAIFTLLLVPSLGEIPSIKQFLVIVGVAAVLAVATVYFRPLRGKK
jgi:hypothetical protein